MKNRIYIFQSGVLKRKDNTIFFEGEKESKFIPVEDTAEILIFGDVEINKRFLEFTTKSQIILHFFNYYGYYVGSYYPREHYNSGYMILRQAEHYLDHRKRVDLAKRFVRGSIENMKKVLRYYLNRGKEVEQCLSQIEQYVPSIEQSDNITTLMGIEGKSREEYYQAFDFILNDPEFSFERRTRRPPQNSLNALISFGNSLLYLEVLGEIYQTHLDPRIGFLHSTNFRNFTLNLDLAEIFKPIIIDRYIFNLLNKKILKPQHFLKELDGIVLNEAGRKLFVQSFEDRLTTTISPYGINEQISYERLVRRELYKLEKHLIGEKEYAPFVSNW